MLDPASGWCIGCLRTIEEIGGWSAMTDAGREAVMAEKREREAKLQAARTERA